MSSQDERTAASRPFKAGDWVCFNAGSDLWDDNDVFRGRVVEVRERTIVVDSSSFRMVVPASDAWLDSTVGHAGPACAHCGAECGHDYCKPCYPGNLTYGSCRTMCPRPDGSFWICSFDHGHEGDHSWADKPTEFWGGDPDVVRPSDPRAGSQAGLSGPSGSPTSPPQRDSAATTTLFDVPAVKEALFLLLGGGLDEAGKEKWLAYHLERGDDAHMVFEDALEQINGMVAT